MPLKNIQFYNNVGNKVTIYDIAEKLNTSPSTVSRALANNPRISQKTRVAVQKLAREMHYAPDVIAHHLRTGRGNVLGIIVPRIDRSFFATIISSFQSVAMRYKYNVIIAASYENQDEEANALQAMIAKKVDGVAMSVSVETQHPDYEEQCAAHNIPLVYFDRVPENVNTDTIENDNFQVGYDAVVQLNKMGCKRIGHFAGPLVQRLYSQRYKGYLQGLSDMNLTFDKRLVFMSSITIEAGNEAAQNILKLSEGDRPDAIFSAGDFPAVTAMDVFRKKGIRVPQDIAIIGVANEPFSGYLATPLSSFDLHQKRMGEMAAKILLSRLGDIPEMEHPVHLTVDHDLILRESSI